MLVVADHLLIAVCRELTHFGRSLSGMGNLPMLGDIDEDGGEYPHRIYVGSAAGKDELRTIVAPILFISSSR